MKKYKNKKSEKTYEIIMPFGTGAHNQGSDDLFDDCPICQEMKRQMELGELEIIPEFDLKGEK